MGMTEIKLNHYMEFFFQEIYGIYDTIPILTINPFSAIRRYKRHQKFFLENLLLARFLCWRDISRDLFFREGFEVFFHINIKKMKNQARNEIFRQMTMTLTLFQKRYLRPIDVKGLRVWVVVHI